MSEKPTSADPLLEELASCLARVREHIYRVNVGGLVVEAGCDLFGLTPDDRQRREPGGDEPGGGLRYPEEVEG